MTARASNKRMVIPMSSTQAKVALAGVIILLASGCAKRAPVTESASIPVTVVLTAPLIPGSRMPPEVVQLYLPIQSKACPATVFVPDVTLVRLDLTEDNRHRVEFSPTVKDRIRKMWGRQSTVEEITRERRHAVEENTAVRAFLTTPSRTKSGAEGLDQYTRSRETSQVFCLKAGSPVRSTMEQGPIVAGSINSLMEALSDRMCREATTRSGADYVVAVYPGAQSPTEETPPGAEEGGDSEDAHPPNAPTCEDDYQHLWQALQAASLSEKKRVDAQLQSAQGRCPADYRFTYARATYSVYGMENHDIAFQLLYEAAEIAIRHGDAPTMRSRLASDSRSNGDPFWRLSTGHPEWEHLIEALDLRDPDMVREGPHAAVHNGHREQE